MVVVGEDASEVAASLGVGEFVDEEGFVRRGVVEPGVGVAGAGVGARLRLEETLLQYQAVEEPGVDLKV